ncbi:MAG: PLDc N-terminal domain-containing protein [Phycisphaerales bacterium JB063]
MEYGIFSLLILVLDIIAIVSIVGSGLDPVMKLVWILVVLFLPVIGMILWFLIGNKATA